LSKDGHPKHPLYIGYAVQPVPWPLAGRIDRTARRGSVAD
jgi:hypothetical protein